MGEKSGTADERIHLGGATEIPLASSSLSALKTSQENKLG
jgi:hypothetical protein